MDEYGGISCNIIAFLDNNRFLSSGDNQFNEEIRLYCLTNKTAVLSGQYQTESGVRCITPMSTRTFLVGLENSNIQLWNSESKKCVKEFQGHASYVVSIAKVDNLHFISGSDDFTAKLWNIRNGGCLHTFKGHVDDVNAVAYIEEGGMLISGSEDKTIKVWSLDSHLDFNGEGGVQHDGVDEEGDYGGNNADAGDSDRASDPTGETIGACGAEEEKREEIAGIASSTTSMGEE